MGKTTKNKDSTDKTQSIESVTFIRTYNSGEKRFSK